MAQPLTLSTFIERASTKYNNKFDYSLVNYTNLSDIIQIICPEHGMFTQIANDHIRKRSTYGCRKCGSTCNAIKNTITTTEYINKALEVHGNRYDYSKTEYKGTSNTLNIICKIHGEFIQNASNHLRGRGCPSCGINNIKNSKMMSMDTITQFIDTANKIHSNKYDYCDAIPTYMKTKIDIICPIHGKFKQSPSNHILGHGCKKCSIIKAGLLHRLSTDEYIKQAIIIHGTKYDYSKTEYIIAINPVIIICPIHGEFTQVAYNHITSRGSGCIKCGHIEHGMKKRIGIDSFISRAKQIHGDIYDYSNVTYITGNKNISIICKTHGTFYQQPNNHLLGAGCQKCGCQVRGLGLRNTQQEFIAKATNAHGDLYDYTNTRYIHLRNTITIRCKKHGDFIQSPTNHIKGNGCPRCSHIISNWERDVQVEIYKKYPDAIFNNRRMLKGTELDIYIPSINIAIECQGDYWHVNPRKYNKDYIHRDIKISAQDIWNRDDRKHTLIRKLGINLILIWEMDWHNAIKQNKLNNNTQSTDDILQFNLSDHTAIKVPIAEWNEIMENNNKNKAKSLVGRIRYNNGTNEIRLHKDTQIPDGFVRGSL